MGVTDEYELEPVDEEHPIQYSLIEDAYDAKERGGPEKRAIEEDLEEWQAKRDDIDFSSLVEKAQEAAEARS